jgi:hypothetical protein
MSVRAGTVLAIAGVNRIITELDRLLNAAAGQEATADQN